MSLQHILKNSSVSGKEPLASQLANGELSINYHADGPFLCCKDTAGNVRRVSGVWVATTAPGTPFPGELWLDISITPSQLKVYKDTTDGWILAGSVNSASTASEGIVRLATNSDTQAGTNATSAVTPASLQSKISDSTSTVSATTIASSTAVKSVGDLASAALPKSGGTITGTLEIGNTGQLRFEGSSNDAYETTLAVEDPTAPRTITLPDRSGTVITTGDTGTVTNTMLAGSIADSKLSTITTGDKVSLSALNIDGATDIGGALSDADLFIVDDGANGTNRKAPATRISDYTFGKVSGAVTITNDGTSSLVTGVVVNSNVSNTAAIAVSKLANGTARQLVQTDAAGTGVEWTSDVDIPGTLDVTGATTLDSTLSVPLGSAAAPSINFAGDNTGIYSPGADQLAISTGGTGRLIVDSSGRVGIGTSPGYALDIASADATANTGYAARIRANTTAGAGSLQFTDSAATAQYGLLAFRENGIGVLQADGASSHLIFSTNSSERARLDSSGRLLLGTSSAYQQFKNSVFNGSRIIVSGDSDNTSNLNIHRNANDEFNAKLIISKARGSTYQSVLSGDILGSINFAGADNSGTVEAAAITAHVDGTPGANDMPGRLVFSTTADGSATPTERMRIQPDGGIRMISPTTSFNWGSPTDNKWSISPNNDDFYIANNNFSKYAVLQTQNFTGWSFASDRRIKENIVDLDYGIDQLKQIKARRFNFIGEATPSIGFIAQELQEVVPEAVAGTEIPFAEEDTQQDRASKTMGVTKDTLIPVIVRAFQEAIAKIETLEAKVAALEGA